MGEILQGLCSCELTVLVNGAGGEAETGAPFGRLFDKFFNNDICKKFKIALFSLIGRFSMIEKQNNQRRVIYDPICG